MSEVIRIEPCQCEECKAKRAQAQQPIKRLRDLNRGGGAPYDDDGWIDRLRAPSIGKPLTAAEIRMAEAILERMSRG